MMNRQLIRVQCVRRKQRKWQNTVDDCSREKDTADDYTRDKDTADDCTREKDTADDFTREKDTADDCTREKDTADDCTREKNTADDCTREKDTADDCTREKDTADDCTREKDTADDCTREKDTADDCTREKDTADDCTSDNVYTKLLLIEDEHFYETFRGNNHPEFHFYDTIKVQDCQRLYCKYHCDQHPVTDCCLTSCKYSEHDKGSSTGTYLGKRAGYFDTAGKCSHADDYETIAPVVATSSHSLIVSTWKCVSDKQNTNVYESISGDNASTISSHLTKTVSFKSPHPRLKISDEYRASSSMILSSVQCPRCVPFCHLGGVESYTSCRQNIIVHDDSDYAEIEIETGDVKCNEVGVSSADQYVSGGDSLQPGRLIYRDAFCRKAFKRK